MLDLPKIYCFHQVKDKWAFQMTGRHELYADLLNRYVTPNFAPQIVKDPLA
jgi:hypothetical protein